MKTWDVCRFLIYGLAGANLVRVAIDYRFVLEWHSMLSGGGWLFVAVAMLFAP